MTKKKGGATRKRAPQFEWPGNLEKLYCDAYEEYHCLWDTDDDGYYEKDKRQASLEELGKRFNVSGQYSCNRMT